jgi:hypothetical protein
MIKSKTHRGFALYEFKDSYDVPCSLQKSSSAEADKIWLGVDESNPRIMASKTPQGGTGWVPYPISEDVMMNTRMHLTIDQVKELLPILKKFVKTGEI